MSLRDGQRAVVSSCYWFVAYKFSLCGPLTKFVRNLEREPSPLSFFRFLMDAHPHKLQYKSHQEWTLLLSYSYFPSYFRHPRRTYGLEKPGLCCSILHTSGLVFGKQYYGCSAAPISSILLLTFWYSEIASYFHTGERNCCTSRHQWHLVDELCFFYSASKEITRNCFNATKFGTFSFPSPWLLANI